MIPRRVLLASILAAAAWAQPTCPDTPVYSPCDLVYELNDAEAAEHPKPYLTVKLHAEFRSPEARTSLMNAFWDGGRRLVIRFTPIEVGQYVFRPTSNIARLDGKQSQFTATESDSLGFVTTANVRHFAHTTGGVKPPPHLWMGDTSYRFAVIDRALFEQMVNTRAEQKFNHIRGLVTGNFPGMENAYLDPDTPDAAYFQELDYRIRYMNERGITADLILAGDENDLANRFSTRRRRQRFIQYLVSRYAPMNVTWQGVQEFEEYKNGRAILKEVMSLVKRLDPYNHPRSTHTTATSAPLLADGWMDYLVYQTSTDDLPAIEREVFPRPQVNAEFGYEDSGAGKSHGHHVDTDTFRKRLWRMTMHGVYPTYGNTGTYGGRKFEPSAQYLNAPGAEQMTHWYNFFENTRHWELEPFYEVDGGRCLALTGIEYIVYVENPGPVELITEKKTYKVYWYNPVTGESTKQKKEYKGERFGGQPPTNDHDWVLHLSRDGRKQNMLERWHFESRRVPIQEVELNPKRLPYEIVAPPLGEIKVGQPIKFSAKLTRETRATSRVWLLWTGEVTSGKQGFRVLGTGSEGTFTVPESIAGHLPAMLNLRLFGMNLLGKIYSVNRVFKLTK
ncbi:MAG: DUF4038 domain-containing protein [bacterium]|nr:DUF4038 domain-containing protein [bacterium]